MRRNVFRVETKFSNPYELRGKEHKINQNSKIMVARWVRKVVDTTGRMLEDTYLDPRPSLRQYSLSLVDNHVEESACDDNDSWCGRSGRHCEVKVTQSCCSC